ncbi:hypothetical protein [Romboutsia sp.]|uniref:hypothetical protein n=1 Tax=Romboutsia sp. TaxID=1965302 RepID=UPI003F34D992
MNKENNSCPFEKFNKGLVEGIEIDGIRIYNKKFCPSEEGLVEIKCEYSYIYDPSEIIFISQFLEDMSLEAKKLELTLSDLLDIITKHIVDRFYHIELEEGENLYVSEKEYEDVYYACITRIIKNSIREGVNDLYPNFMAYINLIEEEVKKPEYKKKDVKYYQYVKYVKKTVKAVYNDLLEVFFVRGRDL